MGLSTEFPSKFYTASSSPERRYHYLDVAPTAARASTSSSSSSERMSTVPPPPPTLLFLHGFPDTSLTWHHLLRYFSSRGCRCIAPDLLGFGRSSRPTLRDGRLREYSHASMSADLAGLVQHVLGSQTTKVVVIAHDWGAAFAWRFTHYYPELVSGMCSVCIPYPAMQTKWFTREDLIDLVPSFGYQAFFEDVDSTQVIEDNIEVFLRGTLSTPGLFSLPRRQRGEGKGEQERDPSSSPEQPGVLRRMLTSGDGEERRRFAQSTMSGQKLMLDDETWKYYLEMFGPVSRGGRSIEGGLNWYRTRKINYQDELKVKDKRYPSTFPVLVVVPELDAALPPILHMGTRKHIPHAEQVDLEGCGHFVQLERPKELCEVLDRWITGKCGIPLKPSSKL